MTPNPLPGDYLSVCASMATLTHIHGHIHVQSCRHELLKDKIELKSHGKAVIRDGVNQSCNEVVNGILLFRTQH